MEYTKNYQLPLWDKEDSVLRTDFNENNQKIDAALATTGNCKIIAGSYIGTGTYGVDNPTELTFDKQPLIVFVLGGARQFTLLGAYNTAMALVSGSTNLDYLPVTWNDHGLSWYHNTAAINQMNLPNTTYYYIALFATENI